MSSVQPTKIHLLCALNNLLTVWHLLKKYPRFVSHKIGSGSLWPNNYESERIRNTDAYTLFIPSLELAPTINPRSAPMGEANTSAYSLCGVAWQQKAGSSLLIHVPWVAYSTCTWVGREPGCWAWGRGTAWGSAPHTAWSRLLSCSESSSFN